MGSLSGWSWKKGGVPWVSKTLFAQRNASRVETLTLKPRRTVVIPMAFEFGMNCLSRIGRGVGNPLTLFSPN